MISFRLARDRSASKGRLDTGLVRRETFKGNVNKYLAVNLTLADLDNAKSTEDLTQVSPIPSPIPSPQPSPRSRSRSRNRSNPFLDNPSYDAPAPQT